MASCAGSPAPWVGRAAQGVPSRGCCCSRARPAAGNASHLPELAELLGNNLSVFGEHACAASIKACFDSDTSKSK